MKKKIKKPENEKHLQIEITLIQSLRATLYTILETMVAQHQLISLFVYSKCISCLQFLVVFMLIFNHILFLFLFFRVLRATSGYKVKQTKSILGS